MNKPVNVDASAHYSATDEEKPSLLVVVLDTNPFAWAELHENLPLKTALAHILLFVNAHLAFSHANRVAVIASHTKEAVFLHPPPPQIRPSSEADPVQSESDAHRDANKYRLFRQVEDDVQYGMRKLLERTTPEMIAGTNETMIAGALSLALAYINRVCNISNTDTGVNVSRPGEVARDNASMTARILIISVSGDLANQYVSVMNSIFAAQRKKIPIDICKIAGDTVFLQQASDSTGGIYMQLEYPGSLLQYLLTCFIADPSTRKHLITPSQINVDFRAACFCHRRVVDIGFVCSICLSSQCPIVSLLRSLENVKGIVGRSQIKSAPTERLKKRLLKLLNLWNARAFRVFCSPPPGAICTTCGTKLDVTALGNYGGKPVLVKRKKGKKAKKPVIA